MTKKVETLEDESEVVIVRMARLQVELDRAYLEMRAIRNQAQTHIVKGYALDAEYKLNWILDNWWMLEG